MWHDQDTHHAASRQLVEMHHAELDEYKRQQRLLEDKIADMEAEHLREQNEVRDRGGQLKCTCTCMPMQCAYLYSDGYRHVEKD